MEPLFWVDMEMTGLNDETDRILEIACVLTDSNLVPTWQREWVVSQTEECLAGMNAWCQKQHNQSGLIERVRQSRLTEKELDRILVDELEDRMGPSVTKLIIAGNSIHQDRKFLDRYLPQTSKRLHYRMLDVSAWKIVFQTHFHITYAKKNNHRALEDVLESISELKFYMERIKP